MSNNIAVKITADIVDLQSKFGTARAELQATEAEFRKLARASAQGILDDAGKARYAQLTQSLLEQRGVVQGLSGDLAEAGFATSTFGRAAAAAGGEARALGINTSSAVRYTRELFDEFSSGRTRYLPSTLAELAQQGFHLSPAMLAGAGGVAALVAGLGYLVYRAVEASDALDRLHLSSLRAGNEFTRAQLDQLTDQLAQLPSVSSSAATDITTALSSIHLPFQALSAAARIAAEQMAQTGQKADQVGREIAKALDPAVSATELAKRHQDGLTQAQVDAAEAADKSGNANEILAAKLQLLSAPLTRARTDVQEYGRSWGQAFFEAGAEVGLANEGLDGQAEVLKENKSEWSANAQAIAKYTAELQSLPTEKALTFKSAKTGGGESEALAAAQEAANIKHQMAEQEISEANRTLDQIASAQEQARAQELAAAEQAANTKHQIAEREIQQSGQILKQMAADAKREAKEEIDARQSLAQEIERAESNLVQNIVSGRRTLAQSIFALGQEMVAQEIQEDLKAMTTRLLLSQEEGTKEKALKQGGVLYHALIESQKTAATLAGEHARTTATVAGNASRTGAVVSAAAAQKTVAATTGAKTVMADAAKAFSGTYASVAQIPYVGWILAPAAATAAYGAVAAYEGLASLDVGAFDVPQDMVARIHQGEMVVPKTFAQGMRENGGMGGSSESHHYHGDTNISAFDSKSVARMFKSGGAYRGAMVQGLARAYRRGAFSS